MSTAKSAQTNTSVRHKSNLSTTKSAVASASKSKPSAAAASAAPSTERRTTYKPVLDNPLTLLNTYGSQSVSSWRHKHHAARRRESRQQPKQIDLDFKPASGASDTGSKGQDKRKNTAVDDRNRKRRKAHNPKPPPKERPSILDGMTIGINSTTKLLEQTVLLDRAQLGQTATLAKEYVKSDLTRDQPFQKVPSATRRRLRSQLPSAKPVRTLSEPRPASDTLENDLRIERVSCTCQRDRGTGQVVKLSDEHPAAISKTAPFNHKDGDFLWKYQIDLVFVCKPDINPPTLVAHLPTTAAAVNGVREALDARERQSCQDGEMEAQSDDIKAEQQLPRRLLYFVPLDIGAERKLSDALGLRRVAVIGLSSQMPGLEPLLEVIQKHLEPIRAPWLAPFLSSEGAAFDKTSDPRSVPKFIPAHVKHLKTSVPVDLKAAHTAKKQRKQLKKQGVHVAED
ncbi:RNase P and RNase MRP subunit [Microbotryomycetes sp. JL201]|nr:RNase P and RNase MRP subunit [Microbotryomycetes sp. JL201]